VGHASAVDSAARDTRRPPRRHPGGGGPITRSVRSPAPAGLRRWRASPRVAYDSGMPSRRLIEAVLDDAVFAQLMRTASPERRAELVQLRETWSDRARAAAQAARRRHRHVQAPEVAPKAAPSPEEEFAHVKTNHDLYALLDEEQNSNGESDRAERIRKELNRRNPGSGSLGGQGLMGDYELARRARRRPAPGDRR
jgi:hypothetical protein